MAAEALDLSLYAKPGADGTCGLDLAVEGVHCGACINRIETAMKKLPGVKEARLNFTNRRLHVAWAEGTLEPARIIDAGEYRLPRASLRAAARRAGGGGGSTPLDALSGGRRLCRHERHAAVGLDLVGQRHDALDARLLPLGLRPDRAAGRGLCRPALLQERLARAQGALAQHGRADLGRRDPRARHVAGGDRAARARRLFRFRHHAPVLPAGRARARARRAPQDARGGRQSGGAQGRYRALLRRRRIGQRAGQGAQSRRPRAGQAGRARPGRRGGGGRRLRNRRERDHWRNGAPRGGGRRPGLCRQPQFQRHADAQGLGHRRQRADRRDRAPAGAGRRRQVALAEARRPRRPRLCAHGAHHRRAHRARLVACRRVRARRAGHRHRRAHHHLSLRAVARHSGGAGGRLRRHVPRRRHPQRRRRGRAAWPRPTPSSSTRPARSRCRSRA